MPDCERDVDRVFKWLNRLATNSESFEAEIKSVFPDAIVVITGPWVRMGWWGRIIEPGVLFGSDILPEVFVQNIDSGAFLDRVWESFQIISSKVKGEMLYVDILFSSKERMVMALVPADETLRMASSSISLLLADCVGLVPSTRSLLDFGGKKDLLDGRLTFSDNSIVRSNPLKAFEFFFIASQIRSIISPESMQVVSDVFDHTTLNSQVRGVIGVWIGRILKFSLTPSLGLDLIRTSKLRYRLFPMLAEHPLTERGARWRMMMQLVDRAAVYIRMNKIDDHQLAESILYICFLEPLWKQDISYISQIIKSKSKITNFILSVKSSSGLNCSHEEIVRDGILYIRLVKILLFKANLLTREYTPPRIAKSKIGENARSILDRSLMMSSGITQGRDWIIKSRAAIQGIYPHLEECFGLSDLMKGEFLSSETL